MTIEGLPSSQLSLTQTCPRGRQVERRYAVHDAVGIEDLALPDEGAYCSGDEPREPGHPDDKDASNSPRGTELAVAALKISSSSVRESVSQLLGVGSKNILASRA